MSGPAPRYTQSRLTRGLIYGGIGYAIGLSTGFAALGSAVSGAVVFGPIGFVIGWLMPGRGIAPESPVAAPAVAPIAEAQQAPDPVESSAAQRSDFARLEDSLNEIVPVAARVLCSIWNLQMKLLIALGLMPHLVRHPWLLFGAAFVLLGVVFPLGIVFTVTGVAAMHYGAEARTDFLVNLERSTS